MRNKLTTRKKINAKLIKNLDFGCIAVTISTAGILIWQIVKLLADFLC